MGTLFEGVVQTDQGWRLESVSTEEYTIEVWQMLVNWRLVVFRDDVSVDHGYCFFGRGLESMTRAIAAGLAWEDPLHSDPPDFDKKAF